MFGKLKELYDPTPPQPTYLANFEGDFKGNFSQGNPDKLTQSVDEEGQESKEVGKQGTKISKKSLAWSIGIGIVLIILTFLLLVKRG